MILNIGIWGSVYLNLHQKLIVDFLDVGQGDAIYIKAPNGNEMLIDGGPDRRVVSQLGDVMSYGDKNLDVVLATHPDADHIAGLPYVFDSYKVSTFIDNGMSSDTQVFTTLKNKTREEKSQTETAFRGMKIILDEKKGVVMEILSPYMDTKNLKDTNDGSIVIRLSYGSSTFMFTGDAPMNVESYLVTNDGVSLKSDVLKVGHHGSKTSSLESFVKKVSPKFAIISSGIKNRYGHPHKEVLDLLNKFGIKILRTDEEGMVRCESDSEIVECK